MSEKDPYAQKRKNSNDESRMDNERISPPGNDANPDTSGSSQNPKDDINPARPRTMMPDQEAEEESETKM